MIKIENIETYGWEAAIRGMRNPKNSWDKSDSQWVRKIERPSSPRHFFYELGPNDLKLAMTLAKAGADHGKFLRQIFVSADITAPLYLYKEMDTYRMGVEKNSCSTMHKIHAKEFTMDDFSHEHLFDNDTESALEWFKSTLFALVIVLNKARDNFIKTGEKKHWWQLIQLLPSSYNQRRTYTFSYAALRNIYHARKNHKLDEWHVFCEWIESLPYSELITEV